MTTPFIEPDLMPALPEMVMLAMTCLVLVVDLFLPQEKRGFTLLLSVVTLALAIAAVLMVAPPGAVSSFGGSFVLDQLAVVLKIAVCVITILVFVYSRDYLSDHEIYKGEYYVLGLFAALGMMVMISAHSFLLVYLGLELLSLSLYAMIAFDKKSLSASESAMKYFVLGAMASGLLLYGISIFYGITGTLDINQLSTAVNSQMLQHPVALGFALTFIVVGLSFKLGAVPFHMWLPDIYQGSPTSVTLFIGTAPKIAGFAMAIRLLVDGLGDLQVDWSQMLTVLAIASLAVAGRKGRCVEATLKSLGRSSASSNVIDRSPSTARQTLSTRVFARSKANPGFSATASSSAWTCWAICARPCSAASRAPCMTKGAARASAIRPPSR